MNEQKSDDNDTGHDAVERAVIVTDGLHVPGRRTPGEADADDAGLAGTDEEVEGSAQSQDAASVTPKDVIEALRIRNRTRNAWAKSVAMQMEDTQRPELLAQLLHNACDVQNRPLHRMRRRVRCPEKPWHLTTPPVACTADRSHSAGNRCGCDSGRSAGRSRHKQCR